MELEALAADELLVAGLKLAPAIRTLQNPSLHTTTVVTAAKIGLAAGKDRVPDQQTVMGISATDVCATIISGSSNDV